MAGSYPDNPSRRIVYDEQTLLMNAKDNFGQGVAVGVPPKDDIPFILTTQAEIDAMSDEDVTTFLLEQGTNFFHWVVIIFTEEKDIDGGYTLTFFDDDPEAWVAFSTDTTNGRDGTWADSNIDTTRRIDLPFVGEPLDAYRDFIDATVAAMSGVKSMMFGMGADDNAQIRAWHLYGTPSAGATPDRFLILDPDDSDNEFTKPLDFGDKERGNTYQDTFKVKNNSGSLDAANVQMTGQDLYLDAGSWMEYSDDDISYSATLDIGTLNAGAEQLIFIEMAIPVDEPPGPYSARTRITSSGWT